MYEAVDKKMEQERTGYPGQSNVYMHRRNPPEPGQRLVRDYLAPVAAPVQRMAGGEVIQREMSYEEFSGILKEILKRHIESAEMTNVTIADIELGDHLSHIENRGHDLWVEVKAKFQTEENLRILIAKVLSQDTPGVSDPKFWLSVENSYADYKTESIWDKLLGRKINARVLKAFESLKKPIEQTLNDIFYWVMEENAKAVTKIDLTDSDIHTRGVGVCIVTCDKGKFVVKPEDKSFEKAVYGKGEDSLANQFNQYLAGGILGDDFKGSHIGTLDIQLSEGNRYGSKVEFLEHQRFSEIQDKNKIDMKSVESMIAFASLLGLADLHEENAVYSPTGGNGKYQMNFIDAEVGMKYHLLDKGGARSGFDQLYTAVGSGEMNLPAYRSLEVEKINKESLRSYNKELMQEFIEKMKARLKGMSSRLVVIETGKLFLYRTLFLREHEWQEDYVKDLKDGLQRYEKSGLKAEMMQGEEKMIDAATCDFKNGKIPFFTLEFETGKVFHESATGDIMIAKYSGKDGEGFLDHMIRNRVNMLHLSTLRRTKSVSSMHIPNYVPPRHPLPPPPLQEKAGEPARSNPAQVFS